MLIQEFITSIMNNLVKELENPAWSEVSTQLLKNPYNLRLWDKLVETAESNNGNRINKISSPQEVDLLRVSYESLLRKYPLLVNYWIKYAEWEFMLGNTETANEIYEKSLLNLSYSIELWISYLNFKIKTIDSDVNKILNIFESARRKVGYHFHSHEFYSLYLSFLQNYANEHNGFKLKYYVLLRIIIEIPIYHYGIFFKKLFTSINEKNLTSEVIGYLVPEKELHQFANIKDMKTVSLKLKKIFTDVLITTQYKVFQLFYFEKKITRPYYDVSYLSNQEIHNWNNYLNFIELNYPLEYVILCYERCLLTAANYFRFWIRYANFFINSMNYTIAKEILHRGLSFNNNDRLLIKLVDLELYTGDYLKARDLVLSHVKVNEIIPIKVYEKMISIERLMHPADDEYLINLVSEIIKQTNNAWFFRVILNYPLSKQYSLKLFETFESTFKTSYIFWSSWLFLNRKNGADNSTIIDKSLQFLKGDDKLKINNIKNKYKKITSPKFDEEFDIILKSFA